MRRLRFSLVRRAGRRDGQSPPPTSGPAGRFEYPSAEGIARPSSRVRLKKALAAVSCLGLLLAGFGCGEEGVSSGATVNAYVAAPLCAEAERELAREGGKAGDVRVRVVCLDEAESGGRLDLAATGANARRVTEDSTSIAYLEASDSRATRFAKPIVEEAGIAWLEASSGSTAMRRLLSAIAESDTTSLRDSVRENLDQP